MAKQTIKIDNIFGGIAPTHYFAGVGQYNGAIAIDPDWAAADSGTNSVKASGLLRPTSFAEFSGALLTGNPYWILTNPKNALVYVNSNTGVALSYSSGLASETRIDDTFTVTIASPGVFTSTAHGLSLNDRVRLFTTGALPTGLSADTRYFVISAGLTADAFELSTTEGGSAINTSGTQSGTHSFAVEAGNGAAYYNNYLYFFKDLDVSRYGPLDGTPSMVHGVWTASTLGTQTALVNTTYPSMRGSGVYPNHAAHVHNDNKLYFCDFDSTSSTAANRNRGLIHYIRTTFSTTEGTGNDASTYNALDLPLGYMPMDIESYGNDLVIAAIQGTTNTTLLQGKAALFFWDTVSSSFYRMVPIEDALVTALLFVNGVLYVFSGPAAAAGGAGNGWRISQYLGGNTLQTIYRAEEGFPPPAGAVDSLGDRIAWGTNITYPESGAVVMAYGSHKGNLPKGIHCIALSDASASSSDGMVTALKYVEHASGSLPRPIIGWRDASNVGLDRFNPTVTTYGVSVWRSQVFNIGQSFKITRVFIPLAVAVAADMTLIPTLFVDDLSGSTALDTINSTNYTTSQRNIQYFPTVSGRHDLLLQLRWSGTALIPVGLPIEIDIETIGE